MTAAAERLPNTVTKCHTMIHTLREAATDGGAERIAELEAELAETKEALAASETEVEALEAKVDKLEADPDVINAVDVFLDECERIGPLRYDVPQSASAMRAIIGLHDAVGRQP